MSKAPPSVVLNTTHVPLSSFTNFETSITESKRLFNSHNTDLKKQIQNWWIIVGGIILGGIVGSVFLLIHKFDKDWTWQLIYYTTIRITIIGVYIYLLQYCIAQVTSYTHLRELNRQKILVLNSMAGLLATNSKISDELQMMLTHIITNIDDTGMLHEKKETKTSIGSILELVEKFKKPE